MRNVECISSVVVVFLLIAINHTDGDSGRKGQNSKGERIGKQIHPLACQTPDSDQWGTCMFVFDCNKANGTHLGVCRDGFYIGSCCKLPSRPLPDEDSSDNEIDPGDKAVVSPKPTLPPSSTIIEIITEEALVTPIPTTKVPQKDRTQYKDADFFSENGTVLITDPKLICGRQFLPASRIVGGNDAYFGKWPWQVRLATSTNVDKDTISIRTWQNEARTFIHSCGGALLNENWAITAAHCVERVLASDLILRIGEFDLSDDTLPFNYTERRVQLIVPHPKFFGPAKTFEYDLALLRFYEPISFQPNIVPVCIPDSDADDFVGRDGFVTGWGRLYEGGPIPARLNEVQVPIMTNPQCEKMFLDAGYHEKIPHIFLCAGWPNGKKDSCEGDSGGPLVLQTGSDNHWTLAGIISWGIGCARIGHPGVYTRINQFIDWINLVSEF